MTYKIVLTSDRATMTDYSGAQWLGFLLCMPYRLVPRFFLMNVLAPPVKADSEGRAKLAPYALRKVEAALYAAGFREDEVAVVPPEALEKAIGPDTAVVGVHVLDPLGLAPVPHTLRSLMGGGPTCTELLFLQLWKRLLKLKEKYNFKLIVGGPGVWQIRDHRAKLGIDCILDGEGELVFPELCRMALEGRELPAEVDGGSVPVEKIPVIRGPARTGMVQITRGCPRRCQFCNPTMFNFRSMPLDMVLAEAEVNVRGGFRRIGLITEDGLLYGARGIRINRRALMSLADGLRGLGVKAGFCHLSFASVVDGRDVLEDWAHAFYYDVEPEFPQVGLETGSPRLIKRYMAGKPRPWRPEDWPWLVVEGTGIMNDNGLFPCNTMILGLPGETEDDIVSTMELVEDLRSYGCWLFPLLFVPMGRSMLERERFAYLKETFGPLHWELLATCFDHDLAFSRKVLGILARYVKNPMARKLVTFFVSMGMEAVEAVRDRLVRDPYGLIMQASRLNLFSASLRDFVSLTFRRLRLRVQAVQAR